MSYQQCLDQSTSLCAYKSERSESWFCVLHASATAASKCDLVHVDLDALEDAPFDHYEAVSSTWGDSKDRTRIELNGHDFTIGRKLHGLLKQLRAKKT